MKTYTAQVQDIQDVTPDLRILSIQPNKKLAFKAGQYITIVQKGFEDRSYSIANTPREDNKIELHIRRGGALSTYLCDALKTEDSLILKGPEGTCTYKFQCKKPVLALAGGTGLAQIKSIVEQALQTNRDTPVYLYHGARTSTGLYQESYFNSLAHKDERLIYTPVISDEHPDKYGIRYGFLMDHIEKDFTCLKNFRAYMCGVPEMVGALEKTLIAKNIDPKRIHADQWSHN